MSNCTHLKQNNNSKLFWIGVLGVLAGTWINGCTSAPTTTKSDRNTTTNSRDARSGKKVILTTFTVLADMTQNVAGDKAIVESITKPGSEIHGYEPTPSDLAREIGRAHV